MAGRTLVFSGASRTRPLPKIKAIGFKQRFGVLPVSLCPAPSFPLDPGRNPHGWESGVILNIYTPEQCAPLGGGAARTPNKREYRDRQTCKNTDAGGFLLTNQAKSLPRLSLYRIVGAFPKGCSFCASAGGQLQSCIFTSGGPDVRALFHCYPVKRE
jgi:hypothetical protein